MHNFIRLTAQRLSDMRLIGKHAQRGGKAMTDQLSENMENYLETILELESANKVARVKDIADRLGIQRGSASGALKNLGHGYPEKLSACLFKPLSLFK